jgi:hypothetical protein
MDSSLHAHLIGQYVQDRSATSTQARLAKQAKDDRRAQRVTRPRLRALRLGRRVPTATTRIVQ